ncbi:hypothetical protein Ancab_034418 [Ancistrocladus abbreviatus]
MSGCTRVVLFPIPLQGHLNPMFQLADILHSRGFSVSIIHTQFNAPNPADHANYAFEPIDDGLSGSIASKLDVISLFNTLNKNCKEPLRNCLSKMLADDQEEPIACLIADAFWFSSQAVADSLKLPRLVLRTTNASSFVAIAFLPLLREKGYFPIKDSQLEELLIEFPPLKVKDIPRVGKTDQEVLYEFLTKVCKEAKSSHGLIFNTFEELEDSALAKLREEFGIPIFTIGPFHKLIPAFSSNLLTPDRSCICWLDNQAPKSVLYVSFGSLAAISESEFLEAAWGLANSKQPFLWVIRPGLVRGSEGSHPLPDEILDMIAGRGHIVKWAPQQEVLAHPAVGGFWTHGGWNSTFESICEGVPMICLPNFADQMVNARYVGEVWKVGIPLENGVERGEVEKAVRTLLVEKEGEKMRERIACLREKADICLKEGGSSFKSLEDLTHRIGSF